MRRGRVLVEPCDQSGLIRLSAPRGRAPHWSSLFRRRHSQNILFDQAAVALGTLASKANISPLRKKEEEANISPAALPQ
jgi:hypothetical protein